MIIPYLLIAIPFCLFLDIYEQKDVLLFLQDVTCISYWIKGRGAWYVAWLIPVYAVYPLYGRIAHNRNWLSAVLAIENTGCQTPGTKNTGCQTPGTKL